MNHVLPWMIILDNSNNGGPLLVCDNSMLIIIYMAAPFQQQVNSQTLRLVTPSHCRRCWALATSARCGGTWSCVSTTLPWWTAWGTSIRTRCIKWWRGPPLKMWIQQNLTQRCWRRNLPWKKTWFAEKYLSINYYIIFLIILLSLWLIESLRAS